MSSQTIWMDTAEVADRIERSPERVRQLANSGLLPAQRTGSGRRIFNLADVEQFKLNRSKKNIRKTSALAAQRGKQTPDGDKTQGDA